MTKRGEKAKVKAALERIKVLAMNPRAADTFDCWLTALQLIEREATAALTVLEHD